jgi:transcriptional regulator with XRE-family HTH domain
MRVTVLTMKLRDLLTAHGISTIAEFRRRTGLSKQHAWNLWHGQVNIGLRMARRFEERLGVPRAGARAPTGGPPTWAPT